MDKARKLAQVMLEHCLAQRLDVTLDDLIPQAGNMLACIDEILDSRTLYVFIPNRAPVKFRPESDVFASILSIFKLGGTIGFESKGEMIPIPYGQIADE